MRGGWLLVAMLVMGCSARERIRSGDKYMEAGRYAAAGRAYAKAVERRPRNSHALEGAATAWLADGDPEQALMYARRAGERRDAGLPLHAETLIQLGRGAEAVPLLEEAPSAPLRMRWLAAAYLSAGDLSAALTAAQDAEADPGGEVLGLQGWLNARLGNDESALSAAHRLRDADSPQARADAAAILLLFGDAASAQVAQTIETEPLVAHWWKQAVWKIQTGETEAALRQLMWLWAIDPDDARYSLRAGQLLIEAGEPAVARRALRMAVTRDETLREGWSSLTRACAELKAWTCSADARTRLIALTENPSLQDWLAGARAWKKAESLPGLIAMWESAIRRQEDQPTHYYHLAGSLMEADRIDEAVGYARLAWRLVPGDAEVALLLGELYLGREEYTTAAQVYREAISNNPSDSRLRAGLETVLGYIPY